MLTRVELIHIFLLKQWNPHQKLVQRHSWGEITCLLIGWYEIFFGKFIQKLKLFTENHPFVETHFIWWLGNIRK
jgi:hypothetical protein